MRSEPPFGAAGLLLAILLGWLCTGTLGAQRVTPSLRAGLDDVALVPAIRAPALFQAPFVFECPASLDVISTGTAVPTGWTFVPGENRFSFATTSVFQGDPNDMAELVPDDDVEIRGGKTAVSEWTFYAGTEVWLGCRYDGTRLRCLRYRPHSKFCAAPQAGTAEGTAWLGTRKKGCL